MLPGPTIIIACPHCGQYAKKKTLISGNTFGAELWSDGKQIAPMLPEFPSLVRCKKCKLFYWVEDAKEAEKIHNHFDQDEKWQDVDYVKFLTLRQYLQSLKTITNEKFIRIRIWWRLNDYYRNGHQNKITPELQKLYLENLNALLPLLSESDDNDLLTKVEILRNLSRFEESKQLLDKVTDPALTEIKEKFLAEISVKNSRIFRLY